MTAALPLSLPLPRGRFVAVVGFGLHLRLYAGVLQLLLRLLVELVILLRRVLFRVLVFNHARRPFFLGHAFENLPARTSLPTVRSPKLLCSRPMNGRRYVSRSRFLSFSTTSRFSLSSAGPSEACRREGASPLFLVGSLSPALASVSFLLRSSMSLKRFIPIYLLPPYRYARRTGTS